MQAGFRKLLWRLVRAVVLAAILVLAYKFIDFRRVWSLILAADTLLILTVFALATLDRFLMAWKWRQLLLSLDFRVSVPSTVSAVYQASIVSYVPFMVGASDLLRAFLIVKKHGRSEAVLATIILEKALGVLSACILGVLGLSVVLDAMESGETGYLPELALGSLLLTVCLFGASLYEPFYRRVTGMLGRFLPERLIQRFETLYTSYLTFRRKPGLLARNLMWTLTEQVVQFLMLLFAGLAIGVDLQLWLFLAVIGLVLMVRRAAIYLEGWGFAETVSILLFGLVAVDRNTALSLSLIVNGVAMISQLPGAWLLARNPVRLTDLSGGGLSERSRRV